MFMIIMLQLSLVMMFVVTFVGFWIHVFATGYMHGDKGFYRFFSYLNLFMFMMLLLVMGSNFMIMFIGWEGVGLCSYLLIGYYFDRKEAGDASKKAFVVNRIGDAGMVMAVSGIFAAFGTLEFSEVQQAVRGIGVEQLWQWGLMSWLALVTVAVFVTLGTAAPVAATVIVIGGSELPGSSIGGCEHVTVCPEAPHVQPAPTPLTNVSPAGNVSVTTTVLSSRWLPAKFETVSV